jgi:alcohol dehydrogenase class IV
LPLITYITRIEFDFGAISGLPEALALHGIARPLLVTDPGVAASGIAARVAGFLPEGSVTFDEVPSNPTEAALEAALGLYQAQDCDGIVALGGGSCLDLGKAAALIARQGGGFADYQIAGGGSAKIEGTVPWIAVPTAAGTGAEVGRAASLTLHSGHKVAAVSLAMVPRVVICDPELTLSLPPAMTAATGMDALSHGIEAYLSNRINPPAEAIALDCVARVAGNLERAVADGSDRAARWEMMMGALEGGLTMQKGLGAVHAMAHPLGERDLHHGTLNAVTLPAALRFNAPAVPEKMAALAKAAGLGADGDLAGWIEGLNAAIGMPAGLAEMAVEDEAIPALAEAASKDHLSITNPRPASAADYEAMLRDAM